MIDFEKLIDKQNYKQLLLFIINFIEFKIL